MMVMNPMVAQTNKQASPPSDEATTQDNENFMHTLDADTTEEKRVSKYCSYLMQLLLSLTVYHL